MADTTVYNYDLEIFKNCFTCAIKEYGGEMKVVVVYPDRPDELEGLIDLFSSSGAWFSGYNSMHFDDQVMNYLIDEQDRLLSMPRADLLQDLYGFSQRLIKGKDSKYKYNSAFYGIDLMQVGGLRKSLKMVAINLGWPWIQDFPYDHNYEIQPQDLQDLREYNENDVLITERLYEELRDELNLRAFVSGKYGVNVYSKRESGIANVLLRKLYADRTGIPPHLFTKQKTRREEPIPMEDVIHPDLSFQTPGMQDQLRQIKACSVHPDEKFKCRVALGNMEYTMAQGGLHSENRPSLIRSNELMQLVDADVGSYYPFTMFLQKIKPEHLEDGFLNLLEELTRLRLRYKEKGMRREADALKIVINSIFGKTGDEYSWLYDPKAMYGVTINGQLFLLDLIERLEVHGFEVVYANTDGVTAKVPTGRRDEYESLCQEWCDETGYLLDYENFEVMAIADVNNLIVQKESGSVKRKGRLNKKRHLGTWGLGRSFDKPVVPLAIEEYLLNGTPPEVTISEHEDVMDFCMAHKPGKKFDVYYEHVENGQMKRRKIQRSNRYFICKTGKGGSLIKKTPNKEQVFTGTSGHNVYRLNDEPNIDVRSLVEERYYVEKAYQEITPIDNKQLTLL